MKAKEKAKELIDKFSLVGLLLFIKQKTLTYLKLNKK
jgi:hypothetical protein